jgi:hypothetical protein
MLHSSITSWPCLAQRSSNRSAAPDPEYRKSWTYRTSTWRLDLSQVQLSQLASAKGLPDVLSLYVSAILLLSSPILTLTILDAEGNGDSISTAVQAERIALLTSVLAQNGLSSKLSPSPTSSDSCDARPPSLSSTDSKRSVIDISNAPRRPLHCSSSNIDLTAQYINSQPIYQTSGHRQPSPSVPYSAGHVLHAPAPLLPSFLQDIIQSPTLSPVSSSSPLSFDGYEASVSSPARSYVAQLPSAKSSLSHLPSSNIWRLDGEETKNLSAIASTHRRESLGGNPTANSDIIGLSRIHIA